MPLRPYQETGIKSISQAWREGHKSIVAVAPGGSGKTVLAEVMTERALASDATLTDPAKQFDVWFLSHRQELIYQPYDRYIKRGIRAGIVKAGVKPNPLARVQVASIKTVINRTLIATARKRALVFIDEGHHSKASEWLAVIESLKRVYTDVFIILLTATPYRLDGQGLGDIATKLIEITTPRELISQGWIMNPTVYLDEHKANKGPIPIVAGDYSKDALAEKEDQPKLVANITDTWVRLCDGCPGVGFAINVGHSEHIKERFNSIPGGIRAGHLDGTTSPRERKRLLARLAVGGQALGHPLGIDVLCNVDVLTEGFDSESSYEMVLNDPNMRDLWLGKSYPPPYQPLSVIGDWAKTNSMGRYIQRAVRNCRIHPNKKIARYLDHSGNTLEHCFLIQHEGFTLDDGAASVTKNKGVPKQGKYICLECSKCHVVLPPDATRCPECGSVELHGSAGFDAEKLAEAPGELAEAKQIEAPRKQLPHEMEAWLRSRIRNWQADNERRVAQGKAPAKFGMIWHQYQGMFGRPLDTEIVTKVCREFGVR